MAATSALAFAADDSAYYSNRSTITGFQNFKSNLPNRTLPTVKEQLQSYRMASYSVPHRLSAAAAAKQAKWFKEAGFNMILAENCRMLVMDLLPASERTAKLRSLGDTIKDSKMIFDALKKEGIKYVFYQDIFRASDMKSVIKATVETVCIVNGRLNTSSLLDEKFESYLNAQ